MTKLYRALLHLYPGDYRALFAEEMLRTHEAGLRDLRGQRVSTRVRWALAEFAGVLTGAAAQWAAKLRPHSSRKGAFAEAGVRMPGLDEWPSELTRAEERVAALVGGMVSAIAARDFKRARACSIEEEGARREMMRLRGGD